MKSGFFKALGLSNFVLFLPFIIIVLMSWQEYRLKLPLIAAAKTDVISSDLCQALQIYKIQNGTFPAPEAGLKALAENIEASPRWRGPYVDGRTPTKDGWNRAFRYELSDAGLRLRSSGNDGIFDTEDDLIPPCHDSDDAPVDTERD